MADNIQRFHRRRQAAGTEGKDPAWRSALADFFDAEWETGFNSLIYMVSRWRRWNGTAKTCAAAG